MSKKHVQYLKKKRSRYASCIERYEIKIFYVSILCNEMFFNELSFSFRLVRIVSLNSDYYRMYVFNIDWTEAVVVWVTRIIQHLTVIELLLARYNGKSVLQPNVPRGWWGGLTFILQIMWKEEFLSIIFFIYSPPFPH